jgi:xylose isomerase
MTSTPSFPTIEAIRYEGPDSTNPLAFRWYEADRVVAGRPMREHLRFAVCWWHSFSWSGADTFGSPVFAHPWYTEGRDEMERAALRCDAAFEFFEKLGVDWFTFHDRDLAPEGASFRESQQHFARMLDRVEAGMQRTGRRLLWGTANLFGHPRYASGAATSPDPDVFACAAAQVADALESTHRLGGANYVLWGGREGYDTLLNTDLRREAQQLARFLSLVAEHKARIGFRGTLLIEPKPFEPTKHQYDFDAAAVHAFLVRFGLEKEFRLNIETNHATLAGHDFAHEVAYAIANDLFGSVDANRGDPRLGWDTDQFPNDIAETTQVMMLILGAGGLGQGGFNFDAKLRRASVAAEDLFHAHIGGMDALARGLLNAVRIVEDGEFARAIAARYAGWDGPLGRRILGGESDLAALREHVRTHGSETLPASGRQEYLENRFARYL